MEFKVFYADYLKSYRYGARDEYHLIIVAECESVALGIALERCPITQKDGWSFEEINTDERGIGLYMDNSN